MNATGSLSAIPASAKLVTGSIPRHLVNQTLPAIIGVAAIMSIGIVDAYFIGQLGRDPLAAIAFIFPVTVATTSLGIGIMVGINSVVARALGESDLDQAARRANFGIVFAVGGNTGDGHLIREAADDFFVVLGQPSQGFVHRGWLRV